MGLSPVRGRAFPPGPAKEGPLPSQQASALFLLGSPAKSVSLAYNSPVFVSACA